MYGPKKMQEGGIASMIAPAGVQNQMYGQPQRMPSRVPGYDAGYSQAPGQPRLPAEPYPIGRPTGVVGGPAYYTPPGFQAPPQPTEAFMPTDRMPDPIGQQFMRQLQSPMGQQFQAQYEATQAPIRAREAELREAERARQDQRFQEMMGRIAELEGQLSAREEAATIPQIDIPGYDPNNPFNIDLSGLPDLSGLDLSGLGGGDVSFLQKLAQKGLPTGGGGGGFLGGIKDRIRERFEDIQDRARLATDSVTGEVIPEEEVILRPMPVDTGRTEMPFPPSFPIDRPQPDDAEYFQNLQEISFTPDQRLRPGGLPPKTLNNGAPGATIMEGPQATTFPGLPKFDPSSLPTLQEMLSMDTPNIGKIVDPAMPKVLPRIPNIPMPRPNMPSAPLGIQRPPKLGFGKMRQ